MFIPLLVIGLSGAAAAALGCALALWFFETRPSSADERLAVLLLNQPKEAPRSFLKAETWRDQAEVWIRPLGAWAARLRRILAFYDQANLPFSLPNFCWLTLSLGCLGAAIAIAIRPNATIVPLATITGLALPIGYVVLARRSRLRRFSIQLPEALDLLARAMRSGQSLTAAMRAVSDEMLPPITEEFTRCCDAISMGMSVDEALEGMLTRVPSSELEFFLHAVQINKQSGGNLAEVLDKISGCMRERFRIEGQLHALTGEGRISGLVLTALPIGIFFAVLAINPEYVSVLFKDPIGKQLLSVSIALQILGMVVIQKMVKIDV